MYVTVKYWGACRALYYSKQ